MLRALYRIGYFIGFKLRYYLVWSRLYRWFRERKYKKMLTSMPVLNIAATESEMRRMAGHWRNDTWRSLWDASGGPYYFEAVRKGLAQPPEHDFDCDSFASWVDKACIASMFCLSVSWMDGKKPGGHVVAVCRTAAPAALWHMSNWGRRGPFSSVAEIIKDVLGARLMIGWGAFSWDLKYIDCSTKKLPNKPEWYVDVEGISER